MKYSKSELFSIRRKFRENRKGVFNFCRKIRKLKNFIKDDLN